MDKLYSSKVDTLYQAGPLVVGAIPPTNSGPAGRIKFVHHERLYCFISMCEMIWEMKICWNSWNRKTQNHFKIEGTKRWNTKKEMVIRSYSSEWPFLNSCNIFFCQISKRQQKSNLNITIYHVWAHPNKLYFQFSFKFIHLLVLVYPYGQQYRFGNRTST